MPRDPSNNNFRVALPKDQDAVCRLFSAPIRREIVYALTHGELDVTAIATGLDLDLSNISRNLKPLRAAGAVVLRKEGWRHIYKLGESVSLIQSDGQVAVRCRAADGTAVVYEVPAAHPLVRWTVIMGPAASGHAPQENAR